MPAGEKVFFLYPTTIIQEQLVTVLFHAEYEVYKLRDPMKARRVLARFPSSILFINVDERKRDLNWKTYISDLSKGPGAPNVKIGILSQNNDPNLLKRYLGEDVLACGCVPLAAGLKESARTAAQALESNSRRDSRRFLRAKLRPDANITFNVRNGYTFLPGRIHDISAAGIAGYFSRTHSVTVGQKLSDVQLNLKGTNVRIAGVVVGLRQTVEGTQFVLAFLPRYVAEVKQKIRSFVHNSLQGEMDRLVASL